MDSTKTFRPKRNTKPPPELSIYVNSTTSIEDPYDIVSGATIDNNTFGDTFGENLDPNSPAKKKRRAQDDNVVHIIKV